MATKMSLNELNEFFCSGRDFELTDIEYETRIGKPLPKSDSYIRRKDSPLGRKAAEYGYNIRVVDKIIQTHQRVIICTKEGNLCEKD